MVEHGLLDLLRPMDLWIDMDGTRYRNFQHDRRRTGMIRRKVRSSERLDSALRSVRSLGPGEHAIESLVLSVGSSELAGLSSVKSLGGPVHVHTVDTNGCTTDLAKS